MPHNCETSYRGMESLYADESRELNLIPLSNGSHHTDSSPLSKSSSNDMTTTSLITYNEPKVNRQDYPIEMGKTTHSYHSIDITSRVGSCKKTKLNNDTGGSFYPDSGKVIDEKVDYLLAESSRKIPHPMAPLDVNRVTKADSKSNASPVTINSYSYMVDGKMTNPHGFNSETHYHSSTHSIKPFPPSSNCNSSSSSGQENHSPSPPSSKQTTNSMSLKPNMTNLSSMSSSPGPTYRNGYIRSSASPSNLKARSENSVPISPEVTKSHPSQRPNCTPVTLSSPHVLGPINGSISTCSTASVNPSSCSSAEKILTKIDVVNLNSEITTSSHPKESSLINNNEDEIVAIPNFITNYPALQIQTNDIKNHIYPVNFQSSTELRRARYKETWDFLNKSDLIEVTMKTADLLKRNQMLQRDIDRLKEEVAKIIPQSTKAGDDNQMRLDDICMENSA